MTMLSEGQKVLRYV